VECEVCPNQSEREEGPETPEVVIRVPDFLVNII
jgi:hypothetical protein